MEVLHLDYRPGIAGWVLPLQTRLQGSPFNLLRRRYQQWGQVGLAELGMAVATRFSLTLRVAYRLGELIKRLRDEIAECAEIDDLLSGGYAFTPKDSRILYDICVAVDALYFQTAPWIALEIHQRQPLECSLLVMRENIEEFDDPDQYVTQRELVGAIEGFQASMWAVRRWLEEQITEIEGAR